MNLRFTNPPPPLPPLTRCASSGSRFRDEEGSLALIERGAKRFSLNLHTQSIDSLKRVARGVLLAVRVLGFPFKKEKPSSERKNKQTPPPLSLSLFGCCFFFLPLKHHSVCPAVNDTDTPQKNNLKHTLTLTLSFSPQNELIEKVKKKKKKVLKKRRIFVHTKSVSLFCSAATREGIRVFAWGSFWRRDESVRYKKR